MARRFTSDLSDWFASLRFSGFTVLTVSLLIVGALVLAPTITTYVQQQREIAELRESVALHRQQVAQIEEQRLNWQDPAYVRAQARGRLFFVMPGETQLSVVSDTVIPPEVSEETDEDLSRIERNWVRELAVSTIFAGVTDATADQLLGSELGESGPMENEPEESAP